MRDVNDGLLAGRRVCSRAQLLTVVTTAQLDDEVRRRHLVTVFRSAYARPWYADDPDVRERAAVLSVGGTTALSHLCALRRWGLAADLKPIHIVAPERRRPRGRPGELVVHRTRIPTPACLVEGVRTVTAELAVVQSWPLLAEADRRGPAIRAVRSRLITVAELATAATASTRFSGRATLLELCELLASGCESELEIWGYLQVFDVPGLRHGTRQLWVRMAGRSYRIDLAYEAEKVAVELDGRAYHAGRDAWERDIARDLALATAGWVTIRLSHQRLTNDVAGCRRDVLAVLAARRVGQRTS